ncbi:MAG: hypothetical protein C0425_10890 [Chlorobiaceae bacterium]|nr:hypothetical protein [Chlorobiaceae bacterium]
MNRLKDISLFIALFLNVYLVNESAPMMLNLDKTSFSIVLVGITFLISFLVFFLGINKNINLKLLLFFIFLSGSGLISIIYNQDYSIENFYFIFAISSAFFLTSVINQNQLYRYYIKIMMFISVYSLLATYILLPLQMNSVINWFSTYESYLGTPFLNMVFTYSVAWEGVIRNQGIFREPGVFQFYLLIALMIELFYFKAIRKNIIFIFSVTILSTFSTVGIICYLILISLKFNRRNITNIFKFRQNKYLISIVILIVIVLQNSSVSLLVKRAFEKLFGEGENVSSVVRVESILNNLEASIISPIFGNGFVNGFKYIQNNLIEYAGNDITGTNFSYIMALGIISGLLILFMMLQFTQSINGKNAKSIILLFILLLSLNTQNLVYSSMLWIFLFSSYTRSDEVKCKGVAYDNITSFEKY